MRRGLAVGLVLALVAPALAQKKPNYHTHKDGAAGYTAIFPGEPRDSSKQVASVGGNLTIATQRLEYKGVVYSVTSTEYPESFGEVSADKVLDGVRDGMKGTDGKVFEEKIDLDGVAGRFLRVEAKKNAVRAKVFLNKRRLYQVMVSGPADPVGGKDADDFLASFGWYK